MKYLSIFKCIAIFSAVTGASVAISYNVISHKLTSHQENSIPTTSLAANEDTDTTQNVENTLSVEDEINDYIDKHIGQPFPTNLTFQSEDGKSQYPIPQNEPYLIHITDTSCSSCIEMIQNSSQLKERITNIIVSDTDSLDAVKTFKQDNNFTEPFYLRGSKDTFATLLDLDYYPTTFLVDEKGIINQIFIGNISADIILDSVSRLISR